MGRFHNKPAQGKEMSSPILQVEEEAIRLSAHPALCQITQVDLKWGSVFEVLPTYILYPNLKKLTP